MTNLKWSKTIGALIVIFSLGIPLFVVFMMYMSLDETTSNVSMNILGVFVSIGLLLAFVRLIKRRIKIKKETGLPVSKYLITLQYALPPFVSTVLVTWFLYAVKGEIETLYIVMFIIAICEGIAFALKFLQMYFDIKTLEPPATI
jgi:hypothetical protein